LPAIPKHVFGRDEMVEKVIGNVMGGLEKGSPQHTALIGAVGTGKSTVARVVANHVTIARAFGRARHWVSCQTLPTVKGLLNGLANSLPLEKRTTKPLEDVISYLYDNPSSLLIVFDDFSLPENAIELKLLEDALERLNQTTHVHMLLTSRDLPLPGNVGWLHLLVQPLSPDAAVDTFKAISPYHDNKIDDLVQALDCNPFAIVVMARLGELEIYPAELLQRLRSTGQWDHSPVDNAIQMSLSSDRFASNPEALTLLAILAKLPKGAHHEKLAEIAPEIKDHREAEATILASSLATRETDEYVQIQAPTRDYLARNHVLEPHHLHALRAYYFRICELCRQELGTKGFECAAKVLSVEGANARAILLEALERDPSTDVIRAAIGYAAFLYHDVPSTDVIVKTIEVIEHSPSLDPESILLPFCYFYYGKLSFRFDRHQEARLALEKAEDMWALTNNHSDLGNVYNFFGQIYRLLGDEVKASDSYAKARGHCEKVQDHAGICESLRGLAILYFHTGDGDVEKSVQLLNTARQHAEGHEPSMLSTSFSLGWVLRGTNPPLAVDLLTDARQTYIRYGARYQTALCTYQMGIASYESGRYDEGKESLLLAYQEFDVLDNYGQMGFTLHHLVALEEKREDFAEALRLNTEVRSVFGKIQYHAEVARSLVSRGRLLTKMGNYVDAREAYEEARVILAQHNCGPTLMKIINEEVPDLVRLQQASLSGK
jgi:tetratricopeptide (TPR) repeat protein